MNHLSSSLGRAAGKSAMPDEELRRLARAAWHLQGIAVIRLDDVPSDWDRQVVTNVANRLHGRRSEQP